MPRLGWVQIPAEAQPLIKQTMNAEIQILITREAILDTLNAAPSLGLGLESLTSRIRYTECLPNKGGKDCVLTHLTWLQQQGMVFEEREKLSSGFSKYKITTAGIEYLEGKASSTDSQKTEDALELPQPAASKRSLSLKLARHAIRGVWAFAVWLFTDVF